MSVGIGALRAFAGGGALGALAGGLQLLVAIAFVMRSPERRAAGLGDLAAALPSLLVAGVVMAAAARSERATGWATGWAVVGGIVAVGGIASLGRSFAVLPGVRTLRTGGLYMWVRHPIYLGEGLIFLAAATQLGWIGATATAVLAPALAWRIRVEERLLAAEPGWREWAERVRWRLVPGVW